MDAPAPARARRPPLGTRLSSKFAATFSASAGADMRRAQNRESVWSLHGLVKCLQRRGETKVRAWLVTQFAAALAKVDAPITSSFKRRTSDLAAARRKGEFAHAWSFRPALSIAPWGERRSAQQRHSAKSAIMICERRRRRAANDPIPLCEAPLPALTDRGEGENVT